MANRYSGNVTIRIKYHDPRVGDQHRNGRYSCSVSWPGGRRSVEVGAPAFLSDAVDSPIAYDDTARAALGFITADERSLPGDFSPAYSDSGYAVRRKK